MDLHSQIEDNLQCPDCNQHLSGFECDCGAEFDTVEGQVDLRPTDITDLSVTIDVPHSVDDDVFSLLGESASYVTGARRNSDVDILVNRLVEIAPKNPVVLDFGCGDCRHRQFLEGLGCEYVGVDIDSDEASFLADGVSLPFSDETFDAVFSLAVLEHVDYPRVVAQELKRVAKPGAPLVGTVAFMEEFHGDSKFHMTHYGVANLLTGAGFNIQQVSPYHARRDLPGIDWEGPIPQSRFLFYGLPLRLRFFLAAPLYWLHRLLFTVAPIFTEYDREELEEIRCFKIAGQYAFIATA